MATVKRKNIQMPHWINKAESGANFATTSNPEHTPIVTQIRSYTGTADAIILTVELMTSIVVSQSDQSNLDMMLRIIRGRSAEH